MTAMPERPAPLSAVNATLRLISGLLLGIFGIGIATGVIAAIREHGEFGRGGAVGIGLAALVVGTGVWLMLSVRNRLALPRSPRVRRSRIALYVSLGVSLVVGAFAGMAGHLASDTPGDGAAVFSQVFGSGPIAGSLALAMIAGWIIAIAVSVYWHRTLDEIERAEYEFGGMAALYAYVLGAPCWWLAWRGGLAPEPDSVAIFMMVCVVWCIGWGWRRYR